MNHEKLVLAGIDGSSLTEAVCDYAAWIALRLGAPLKLLHTIDHHPESAVMTDLSGNIGLDSRDHLLDEITSLEQQRSKLRLQQGKQLLENAKARVMQSGIVDPITNQRHGSLVESLIELEQDLRVLVIGIRGKIHENQPDKLGAKLESIIRSLHVPILVVNDGFKAPQEFMVAYDGGKAADKAVDMVASSPLFKGMTCHLVCVAKDNPEAEKSLRAAADKLTHAGGISVIPKILHGEPKQILCDYLNQHPTDMTVMGAFSHTRLHDLLLGSFTVKMLMNNKKPLLMLR